jgi:hypothetical protein
MAPFYVFETDHPDAPVVEVRLVHAVHRPTRREADRGWVFIENRVVVPAVAPGDSATFELPIIWSQGKRGQQVIHSVESTSPDFEATLEAMRPDGTKTQAIVRITPRADVRGPYQGRVEFVSNEHRASLPVIGYVNRSDVPPVGAGTQPPGPGS